MFSDQNELVVCQLCYIKVEWCCRFAPMSSGVVCEMFVLVSSHIYVNGVCIAVESYKNQLILFIQI